MTSEEGVVTLPTPYYSASMAPQFETERRRLVQVLSRDCVILTGETNHEGDILSHFASYIGRDEREGCRHPSPSYCSTSMGPNRAKHPKFFQVSPSQIGFGWTFANARAYFDPLVPGSKRQRLTVRPRPARPAATARQASDDRWRHLSSAATGRGQRGTRAARGRHACHVMGYNRGHSANPWAHASHPRRPSLYQI